MPDVREKLVELLMQNEDNLCDDCGREPVGCAVVAIADHLIANGVTIQRWVPVTERLPDKKIVIQGEEYLKTVAVRVKDCRVERIALFVPEERAWFDADGLLMTEKVTHWNELPEWD